jgi:hypothetical protein
MLRMRFHLTLLPVYHLQKIHKAISANFPNARKTRNPADVRGYQNVGLRRVQRRFTPNKTFEKAVEDFLEGGSQHNLKVKYINNII